VGGLLLLLSLMAFQVIGLKPASLTLFVFGFTMVIAELKLHTGFLGFAGGICILLGTLFIVPSPHWLLAPEVKKRIRNTIIEASVILFTVFTFILFKVTQASRQEPKTGPEALIGSTGESSTCLDPTGEVRVHGETWRAIAENPPIDAGCEIEVVSREGLILVVRAYGAVKEGKEVKN